MVIFNIKFIKDHHKIKAIFYLLNAMEIEHEKHTKKHTT